MDRTFYKCPKCGKWCKGAISFRKHFDSEACKRNMMKAEREEFIAIDDVQERELLERIESIVKNIGLKELNGLL